MIRLSAFADEISSDLTEQLDVLAGERIAYLDLRAVWDINVLDLTDDQVGQIERALNARNVGIGAIGSPIGKVPIDSPFHEELHRLERAITLARRFKTPFVRIFSFHPPAGDPQASPRSYRDEVLRRLREMVARARAADITLLHENDTGLYGDTIAHCVDVLQSIADPHLRAVFDPANFIQSGETPYPDAYDALRPWIRYVHVKDATPDGTVTVAGEGASQWPRLLERFRRDGYSGFFSLEPHLTHAGRSQGFSGPDRFREASAAFQGLLKGAEMELARPNP